MAKKTNLTRTQFRIPPALNDKIEEFADANNLSKNQAMILLIEKGLADHLATSQNLDDLQESELIDALIKEVSLRLKKQKRSIKSTIE